MGKEIVAEEDGLVIEDDFEETFENRQSSNRCQLKDNEVLLMVKLMHSGETSYLAVPEEEAEKLISEEYQNTVADAVVSGIEKYIN